MAKNRFIVSDSKHTIYIQYSHIIRFESSGVYTHIFLENGKKLTCCRHLGAINRELFKTKFFFRSHKSHLINLNYVVSFQKADGGSIQMIDGSSIPLAHRRRSTYVKLMQS